MISKLRFFYHTSSQLLMSHETIRDLYSENSPTKLLSNELLSSRPKVDSPDSVSPGFTRWHTTLYNTVKIPTEALKGHRCLIMLNRSLLFENRSLFFENRSNCFYRKSEFVFWKSEYVFIENRSLLFWKSEYVFIEIRSLFFENRSMFLSKIGVCFLKIGVRLYRKSEFVFKLLPQSLLIVSTTKFQPRWLTARS